MEYKISGYEPQQLFQNFEDISAVPRGSFHNEAISNFLVDFAHGHGLSVWQDDAYNVIIKKPGSKGAEDKPPVILQGHIDMVCEKVHGCDHDFETEGIDLYVTDDGWVTANGTTLGGDDGIAAAFMMTLLERDDLVHPPLECVFTTDEEVGLLGAQALDFSLLDGRFMINLDSEDEGIATVSCAGGMEFTLSKPLAREARDGAVVSFFLHSLLGGHSGMDIDLGRSNANKLLARLLHRVLGMTDARLVSFNGGNKDNAIPREARGSVWFPTEAAARAAADELSALAGDIVKEVRGVEPDITIDLEVSTGTYDILTKDDGHAIVSAVLMAPDGVRRRDPNMDGFVLTSLNLGIVSTDDGKAKLLFAPRSSVESLQTETLELLELTAETFGFSTTLSGAYPGWEKVEDSFLCDTMQESYRTLFGEELRVEGIHAGLECGLFYANLPGLDPVSIGPTMRGVHTPDEKMDLASCERTWLFVTDILARLSQ